MADQKISQLTTGVPLDTDYCVYVDLSGTPTTKKTLKSNLKGDTGATGATGTAATIAVGTTTTGLPGGSASVTNSGSSSAATFNFTIPRGQVGINWTGAWNSGTTYAAADAVSLSGASYYCILANTNQTPPNGTYWNVIAAAGTSVPAGSTTQVQYNNSGAFGGISGATSDGTNLFIPTLYGGSTASSTLVLSSTSGTGTTDAIIFKTGSQVENGRIDTSGVWIMGQGEGTATIAGATLRAPNPTAGTNTTVAGATLTLAGSAANANGSGTAAAGGGVAITLGTAARGSGGGNGAGGDFVVTASNGVGGSNTTNGRSGDFTFTGATGPSSISLNGQLSRGSQFSFTGGGGTVNSNGGNSAVPGPGGGFLITTGNGGNNTGNGVSATNVAGFAGPITLTLGNGGSSVATTGTTKTGGAAGIYSLVGGTGGAATSTTTTATVTGGKGSDITLTTGAGGAATGAAGTSTAVAGNGGDLTLATGAAGTASGANTNTAGSIGNVIFKTGGTEAMRINGSRFVGIGTTNPGALLDLGLAGTTLGVVRLAGSTSGNVSLQPNVAAGTNVTLTLPASTDTLVGKATTDTLTNKTLTAPVVDQLNAASTTSIKFNAGTYNGIQTYTPTAAGTATLDLSLGNIHHITMPAGNITVALSNGTVGQCFIVRILQDGSGSRTVTWFTTIKWAGGVAPTLTTTASKADTLGFEVTGSNTYDGFVVGQNI